ncbi:thioesterase II family protein [Candidatus Protofrankia californiensis]|uniref:thioesterase II family protein n=1 Tax=Candidatus Protofrankia californiensis TaxID=1839754 RepID=UPI001041830C|nr:alpha/beta fold hydrolase [Candidatus Protofrankia californiensis]
MNPFVRPRPVEHPALRVIGFHHAGGSAAVYHPLIHQFPPEWDLLLLDLPGRGKRHAQTPVEDMNQLVARAVQDVRPWLGGQRQRDHDSSAPPEAEVRGSLKVPVALFGHSLGAILASEVGRAMQAAGTPPVWVGVSGRVPPDTPAGRRSLCELGDTALLAELSAMGGMPDRFAELPEFRERFLQLVRADLRAVDSYRPASGRAPLACPLTVFGGTADTWAPPEMMAGWSRETHGEFRQRYFPGGHFYFLGTAFAGFARSLVAEVTEVTEVGRLASAADRIPSRRSPRAGDGKANVVNTAAG